MPGLSPGTPGAKEVYGISIIREDFTIHIPPKALARYGLTNYDPVLLTSTRKGEGGLAIMNYKKAKETVFKKFIDKIDEWDQLIFEKSRPFTLTRIQDGKIILNQDLLNAFNLKIGDNLLIVKSTTVTLSYSPVEVWKKKFLKQGFVDAIKNLDTLEIF
jgi:hypothetical protein